MASKGSYYGKFRANNPELEKSRISGSLSEEGRKIFEEGRVILIDKPLHWTSFDVVRKIRGALRIKKIGHAGTLDPLASGLLILCTGKFTKKINEYMGMTKEYTGTIILGASTPTYDLESEPVDFQDYSTVTKEAIMLAAGEFEGDILQKPPVYSAIKKDGKPLYELARRGKEVEPEPRPVHIAKFEIIRYELPVVEFRVVCSTGTYIRSLAHDFGQKLGCGAYLGSLRRTKIGDFSLGSALEPDAFLREIFSTQENQNG
jgi:tRNA pseudouridine55 synthase